MHRLPCTRAILGPGRLLKASCKGEEIGFTLDEPAQGSLTVTLQTGDDPTHCMAFGGTIRKDQGIDEAGRPGHFRATNAPAPSSCPLP